MSIKLLLVEDNAYKRGRVIEAIRNSNVDIEIDEARSFTSGCQKLEETFYRLVLLDMTLPTYDRSATESGGRVRIFGGREIARKYFGTKIRTKVAFITQFSSFSDKGNSYTFDALATEMKLDLQETFCAMIYYNSSISTWRDELATIINEISHENSNNR